MLLWTGFAVLTAGVIAFLARPLLRPADNAAELQSADLAVYRDQMRAIETEREQGLLEASEAEAARTELARRILRAADSAAEGTVDADRVAAAAQAEAATDRAAEGPAAARMLIYAASILIPLLSIGIYVGVGSPGMPGTPFAERMAQGSKGRSVGELVGLVETRLRANPDDGKGWEVIAPVYLKQQRYGDAARAYANSIRINGETPDRVAGFAQALVLANNGIIVPDARRAFERLLKLSPDTPEPRFWLALAKEQDGDLSGGIADLEAMLKSAPTDAPWRSMVEGKLGEMRTALAGGAAAGGAPGGNAGGGGGADARQPQPLANGTGAGGGASDAVSSQAARPGPRGPSAADVAAVQQMSPEERSAFISQMVDGLAARLAQNGKDLEGWKRLARAYKVMGRNDDAVKALGDARRALAGDAAAIEAIDALAKDLGIGS